MLLDRGHTTGKDVYKFGFNPNLFRWTMADIGEVEEECNIRPVHLEGNRGTELSRFGYPWPPGKFHGTLCDISSPFSFFIKSIGCFSLIGGLPNEDVGFGKGFGHSFGLGNRLFGLCFRGDSYSGKCANLLNVSSCLLLSGFDEMTGVNAAAFHLVQLSAHSAPLKYAYDNQTERQEDNARRKSNHQPFGTLYSVFNGLYCAFHGLIGYELCWWGAWVIWRRRHKGCMGLGDVLNSLILFVLATCVV
jgi:hypothetical protein